MIKHYQDYYWKMGKPVGRGVVDPNASTSYKIIVDPYFKRFSVEKYRTGQLDKVVYDSYLFDFRHLKPREQAAWQRETIQEDENTMTSLLRNIDDRAILIEEQTFEKGQCRSCTIKSIHGLPVSVHKMYYKALNDPFNGVVLYDLEERPIMKKTYETDPETGEFTEVISENWNMEEK
jgi:hypothetical protein